MSKKYNDSVFWKGQDHFSQMSSLSLQAKFLSDKDKKSLREIQKLMDVLLWSDDDDLQKEFSSLIWKAIPAPLAARMIVCSQREEALKNAPIDWLNLAEHPSMGWRGKQIDLTSESFQENYQKQQTLNISFFDHLRQKNEISWLSRYMIFNMPDSWVDGNDDLRTEIIKNFWGNALKNKIIDAWDGIVTPFYDGCLSKKSLISVVLAQGDVDLAEKMLKLTQKIPDQNQLTDVIFSILGCLHGQRAGFFSFKKASFEKLQEILDATLHQITSDQWSSMRPGKIHPRLINPDERQEFWRRSWFHKGYGERHDPGSDVSLSPIALILLGIEAIDLSFCENEKKMYHGFDGKKMTQSEMDIVKKIRKTVSQQLPKMSENGLRDVIGTLMIFAPNHKTEALSAFNFMGRFLPSNLKTEVAEKILDETEGGLEVFVLGLLGPDYRECLKFFEGVSERIFSGLINYCTHEISKAVAEDDEAKKTNRGSYAVSRVAQNLRSKIQDEKRNFGALLELIDPKKVDQLQKDFMEMIGCLDGMVGSDPAKKNQKILALVTMAENKSVNKKSAQKRKM